MPSRKPGHLTDHELLLFLDGEVEPAREATINQHLGACWTCRARRDDLQTTISTIVRAQEEIILPRVPPPPSPWNGLESRLAGVDAQWRAERRFLRWRAALAGALHASRVRWAAAGLAVVVVSVTLLQQRTVTAAELLARARPIERLDVHRQLTLEERTGVDGRVLARHRIDIWQSPTKRVKARRMYDERNQLVAGEWTRADGLRAVYRRHESPRVDDGLAPVPTTPENAWRLDPAASTFATIVRDAAMTSVDQGKETFVLSSSLIASGDRGTLAPSRPVAVSLTLTKSDLHPIEQSITFGAGDGGRTFRLVEIAFTEVPATEIPVAALTPESELTGEIVTNAPTSAPKPATVAPRLAPEELLGLQVETLVRLDRIGALLGDQVSVGSTADGRLRIDALVDTDVRKADFMRALESLAPRWAVRLNVRTFDEAQQRTPTRETSRSPVVRSVEISGTRAPVYDDLKRFFADLISRETKGVAPGVPANAESRLETDVQQFTGRVLERSLQARLHARALRQVVSRVSAEEFRTLAPDRAQAWRALLREHAGAFRRETETLRTDLQPIFFATPPARSSEGPSLSSGPDLWQAASRLFELASAHDVTVGQAFAVSARDDAPVRLKSDDFWQSLLAAEALAAHMLATLATPARQP